MHVAAAVHRLRASGVWKPSVAVCLLRQPITSRSNVVASDDAALRGAAAWLARAQDATGDGGIAGRYRLASGWSSSYPETTGYTIPTLLTLADVLGDDGYRERAARCVEFLRSVQLPCGAFPALEIADNRTNPSPFNSAQIIHGLHRWHVATGDRTVLDPIVRAGRWICDVQDSDGAWRQYFYRQLACTYSAYAACWLAEIADDLDEPRFRAAAERNLCWVLSHRDAETGFFDRSGFSPRDHEQRRAHTHTIAYTLDGVLRLSERLHVGDARDAVLFAAERLLERLERSKTLAGVLNHRWQPQASYVCLTGNAQIALIWMRLAQSTGDVRFLNAAFKAIDEVKRAQTLVQANGGIRGGVPGSWPIAGEYIEFAMPNWAVKFFIDALCAKRACLDEFRDRPRLAAMPPAATIPAAAPSRRDGARLPVVVYTTRVSPKFASLAARWRARDFAPALVVIEIGDASWARRRWSMRRADDSARICRELGWKHVCAATVNSQEAVRAIEQVQPAVAVAAGAGILKQQTLAVPRLGTLNAHMGILPAYRGMNACEWSAFNGDPVGCSVLWLDEGIDTGPIVATRAVDVETCRSIAELRARVDASQLELLDETLQSIVEHGMSRPGTTQSRDAGRQFFRMHTDLRCVLERTLAARTDDPTAKRVSKESA